ncbi:hypothetical protein ACFPMF_24935 [Larkinella bovis]|uniref:TonB C-terminal domain-containing protein n=1 Tax=Larkinella bovis TaxID=683041 RepID=A0ABW0II85_9BACT
MKTVLIFSTLCLALAVTLRASSQKKITLKQTLEQQIASYALYPEVLQQIDNDDFVIIKFRVDHEQRLADLRISDGDNKSLNATLIKQLMGKKVFLTEPNANENQEYLAKVRFRLI